MTSKWHFTGIKVPPYIIKIDHGEPGKRSRYSDWVHAGRPRGESSSLGRGYPHRFWGPPSLLSNGYWGLKLTTHLQLVPTSRISKYIHSPIRLHAVVLNKLSTGTTLPHLTETKYKEKYTESMHYPFWLSELSLKWINNIKSYFILAQIRTHVNTNCCRALFCLMGYFTMISVSQTLQHRKIRR
jgi:hypothetical protein